MKKEKALSIIITIIFIITNITVNCLLGVTSTTTDVNAAVVTDTITIPTTDTITTTIDVLSIQVTYMTFSGYEKTGYIDRDSFITNKFNYYGTNYDGIDATELVYAEPELINVIGEIYSFGWLWNCEYTIGHITTTTTVHSTITLPITHLLITATTTTVTNSKAIAIYAIGARFSNVRYMYLHYIMPNTYLVSKGFMLYRSSMHRVLTTKYVYISLISIEDLF